MLARTLNNLLVAILFFAGPVWAEDSVVIADFSRGLDAGGVPAGWQLNEKYGKADFAVTKDNDISTVRLRSANTSFSLQKKVNVDLRRFPVLSWKWKVAKLPEGGDCRKSKTDDQAAQLFVAFTKSKSIVYIWDTSAPQGLTKDTTPVPLMHVQVVVVQSGAARTRIWVTETRNVYEDYKKLFGEEPPPASGMRLQINSQHTGTSAESYFADVVFKKQ
jgi:hypothetical protein